jgi:hypothetical protein
MISPLSIVTLKRPSTKINFVVSSNYEHDGYNLKKELIKSYETHGSCEEYSNNRIFCNSSSVEDVPAVKVELTEECEYTSLSAEEDIILPLDVQVKTVKFFKSLSLCQLKSGTTLLRVSCYIIPKGNVLLKIVDVWQGIDTSYC